MLHCQSGCPPAGGGRGGGALRQAGVRVGWVRECNDVQVVNGEPEMLQHSHCRNKQQQEESRSRRGGQSIEESNNLLVLTGSRW